MEIHKTKLWYLTLKLSTTTDPVIISAETKQFELTFKAKLDAAVKRKEIYNNNKTKAYSLIWERCTQAMQSKIKQRTDFDTKLYNNPIELIKVIKEHALNYQETKYSMEIINNTLIHFLLLRQKEDPLHENVKKFKTAKEVAKSHLGEPIILSKYLKTLKDYDKKDNKNVKELQEKSWEKFCAYKFLKNANKQKYGTIIDHLRERKSIGVEEFPDTLTKAINTLVQPKTEIQKLNEINEIKIPQFAFMSLEERCFCCGKKGHKSPQCQLKDVIPKEKWAIRKAAQELYNFFQEGNKKMSETSSLESTNNLKNNANENKANKNAWANTHLVMSNITSMQKIFIG